MSPVECSLSQASKSGVLQLLQTRSWSSIVAPSTYKDWNGRYVSYWVLSNNASTLSTSNFSKRRKVKLFSRKGIGFEKYRIKVSLVVLFIVASPL